MQQLSPEMYPWRRLSAVVYRKKKLSMDEDGPAFASISLPLQPTGEEMAHLQAKYREAIMTPDGATRSVSQLDLVSPSHTHASWLQRPRSASVCSENLQLTRASRSPKKRPSFRISRSRSSSMKIGRKAKSSIETTDNGAGCISVVDSILLKVKEQLAKLSEEDRTLQERMDRLCEDISQLSNFCEMRPYSTAISPVKKETPSPRTSTTQHPIPVLVVTDSLTPLRLTQGWSDDLIKQQIESHARELELKHQGEDISEVRVIDLTRSGSTLSSQSTSMVVSETSFSGTSELVTAN